MSAFMGRRPPCFTIPSDNIADRPLWYPFGVSHRSWDAALSPRVIDFAPRSMDRFRLDKSVAVAAFPLERAWCPNLKPAPESGLARELAGRLRLRIFGLPRLISQEERGSASLARPFPWRAALDETVRWTFCPWREDTIFHPSRQAFEKP